MLIILMSLEIPLEEYSIIGKELKSKDAFQSALQVRMETELDSHCTVSSLDCLDRWLDVTER